MTTINKLVAEYFVLEGRLADKVARIAATFTKAEIKDRTVVRAAVLPGVCAKFGIKANEAGELTIPKTESGARQALSRIMRGVMGVTPSQADKPKVRVSSECVAAVEKLLGRFDKKMLLAALARFA